MLQTRDPVLVQAALKALSDSKEVIRESVAKELATVLRGSDPVLRIAALELLGEYPSSDGEVVLGVIEAAGDPISEVRALVPHALRGSAGEQALPVFRRLMGDSVLSVRVAVASHAAEVGEPRSSVDLLRECLNDTQAWVVSSAASSLGSLGRQAIAAADQVRALLRDRDYSVRIESVKALGAMHARRDRSPMARLFLTSERIAEEDSQDVLEFSERTESLLALAGVLEDEDEDIQVAAVDALGQIGPGAESAVPDALRMLGSPSRKVRAATVTALDSIGPYEHDFRTEIGGLTSDWDPEVRSRALVLLGNHGVDLPTVWPSVRTALESKLPEVRDPALNLVTRMGATTSQLETEIRQVAAENPAVAPELLDALKRVRSPIGDWGVPAEARAIRVVDRGVQPDAHISENEVPIAVASWCHFSKELVAVLSDERIRGYLGNVRFAFFLQDEWATVRDMLAEQDLAPEEVELRLAALRDRAAGAPYFDPEWVDSLPGRHFLIPEETTIDGFPTIYSFTDGSFSTAARSWIEGQLRLPERLLQRLWADASESD